mmetsp:Transcript_17099/g.28625  ORF Transcript_17099/g.28625 Transcript_17099/m.28625 type:complete len:328 (-) Transcript_17099:195-1178(-)|eukprot:CAMPEP_0119310200 /NCGR_PEP_ID=MMETSP1333-20130426/18044_1 /TAXON_ID=418940 /ORGANISM="Scyphosphaera apsteinii, Strain RCC1455" /LENGTH=327 /DNA_ID=CAMNT_0007314339 /DNA_START=35 /DNA_END=1018 /DNA_ORIENTATION=+
MEGASVAAPSTTTSAPELITDEHSANIMANQPAESVADFGAGLKQGFLQEAQDITEEDEAKEEWQLDEKSYIFEERLEKGEQHKAAGNEHFKRGEWRIALKRYERALFHAGMDEMQMHDLMDKHRDMAHAVMTPIKLNYVACVLKLREAGLPANPLKVDGEEEWANVLDYCEHLLSDVIKAEPKCSKAYFRRGQVLMERGDLPASKVALLEAQKIGGSSSGVRETLRKLQVLQREKRQREREMYSGVIQPDSDFQRIEKFEKRYAARRAIYQKILQIMTFPIVWPCLKIWSVSRAAASVSSSAVLAVWNRSGSTSALLASAEKPHAE